METKQYYSSVIPDFLVIYHDLPFPSQIRWATSLFSWSSHITNHHTTGWVHGGMWLSCCGGVWRRSAPFRRQLFARCVGQYGETNDVWGIRMGKSNGKTWQNQWENMGRLHLGNRLREYVFYCCGAAEAHLSMCVLLDIYYVELWHSSTCLFSGPKPRNLQGSLWSSMMQLGGIVSCLMAGRFRSIRVTYTCCFTLLVIIYYDPNSTE